jgi:1-acyl-sn-glycerol-3-phosphate acyltransferase
MLGITGTKIVEIGTLDSDADLVMINHNSMLDILIFDHLHPKDLAWVARATLAKAPIFGAIFRLPRLILIENTKKSSIKELIAKSKHEFEQKRPIAIFPEGTRGKDDDMQKFQIGAKIIADKLNLKVQPIVVTNTRQRLDTSNLYSSSGEVKVVYLDTVTTENKEWYKDTEEKMREVYEANRERLN